jgi:hypothetical protein
MAKKRKKKKKENEQSNKVILPKQKSCVGLVFFVKTKDTQCQGICYSYSCFFNSLCEKVWGVGFRKVSVTALKSWTKMPPFGKIITFFYLREYVITYPITLLRKIAPRKLSTVASRAMRDNVRGIHYFDWTPAPHIHTSTVPPHCWCILYV